MDVDGTLTDGGVYYSQEGLALKKFSVYDGMGITLLHQGKIQTMFLSSDTSSIPLQRAEKLHVTYEILGVSRKKNALDDFIRTNYINIDEIAVIGDDINDIEIMQMCGFAACPSSATPLVIEKVDFISDFAGGEGAVRQICEMILLAQNKPITLIFEE